MKVDIRRLGIFAFFLSLASFQFTRAGTPATSPEPQVAMSCHQHLKNHISPERYEVWEKDGLIFARSFASDPRTNDSDGKVYVQLSFTDGEKVYAVKVPSPFVTTSDGKKMQVFYYEDHRFQLSFPNGKTYCVNYRPRFGTDQLKAYEASPPAKCATQANYPASEVTGEQAVAHLQNIHRRMDGALDMSVYLSERCRREGRCEKDQPEARLAGFEPAKCRSVPLLASSLKRFESFARTSGLGVEASAGEPANVPDNDGVQ